MLSRTRLTGVMTTISLIFLLSFKTTNGQEHFRGMVQLFGNEEGATFITSQEWTAFTKTMYTYMEEGTTTMFPPKLSGTTREYYLVVRKADDIYSCGDGPSFRFWFTHLGGGKAGQEFSLPKDWGALDAGNVMWVKIPSSMDQVFAIRNRDGLPNFYQDYYFRLDVKMPASCPPDRVLRIASVYIAAIDKVGGTAAAINLNNDPVASGKVRNTIGGTTGVISVYDGKVGIGTRNPQSDLAVNGTITAKKIKVTATDWADFVFKENYPLRPLDEVEQFIKTNRRLPDMPSEKEVIEKGNDLGEMDKNLLRKIEELTLYLIELKKENQEIKKELKALKQR